MTRSEGSYCQTLSRLSDDDIGHIWTAASCFIERLMFARKGVYIIGLGTFTFSDLNLGRRPIFLLSEKHCHNYGLKQIKHQSSDVPVVPLNFSALSVLSSYKRDTVEGCVRETLFLLLRAASKRCPASHIFPGIGVLTFQQTRVKMMFYSDFLLALDATGKLSSALRGRPESSCCHTSERQNRISRPTTASAVMLLRISAGEPPITDLKMELSSAQQPPDTTHDKGQEIQYSVLCRHTPPATINTINFSDGCPLNTNRGVKVSQAAVDRMNILTEQKHLPDLSVKCRDHRRAGQELCYVCMQRAHRNIPLYLSDEKRKAEQEQERVLMLNEHYKDHQYFQKEEMNRMKIRADSQQAAALNLAIGEARRHRKSAASDQSDGIYIFEHRPYTPNHQLQQSNYMQDLKYETAIHRQLQEEKQQEQRQLDKLHQLQLCEEVTLLQSQDLHDKQEMSSVCRRALNAQLEHRRPEITSPHGDLQPVFGLLDADPAASAEQRHRAQNIPEELKTTSLTRRRQVLLKRLTEQKREREIMLADHKEMLEKRILHCGNARHLQASCEENWRHSVKMRCQQDQEELNFRRLGSQTLTDQLTKYERCSQCKRKTDNCGKTNIFRDANYVCGSRLML